ncbi:MAG: NYN domain-containing protein [Kastovskya adunca ATA6-11-RM4]|jgi:predicted RNA-binding protein with PIN domain|nr:NYN domain-containing protein [Kastovskya adunca ATA6-11-RM4]
MPPSSPQAVLLVDGYNVIGTLPHLEKTRDRHGLEAARRDLVEDLVNYSALQGFKTEVVFDAQYQDQPTCYEVCTVHVSICYTAFGETADTYIERFCASRKTFYPTAQRLIVATSDRAQQLTVIGYGAEWMSARQLGFEVEATARRALRQHRPKKQPPGRFLFNSLDAKAQQRLADWRKGIR